MPAWRTADLVLLWLFYGVCGLVLVFLVLPVVVMMPLSFNAGSFLAYPLTGFSLRWYEDFFRSAHWLPSVRNSAVVGAAATLVATVLGTAAALGLAGLGVLTRKLANGLLLLPLVVPLVITGSSLYALFAPLGLTSSLLGLMLAHAVIGAPYVVITVSATLDGFDRTLLRAGLGLGARPVTAFRRITLPLIMPGVMSGAIFAFAASLDEVVVTLLLAGPQQRTLPLQMFDGVREQISPTIAAAATLLVAMSVLLLGAVEVLRRRGARLRGLEA